LKYNETSDRESEQVGQSALQKHNSEKRAPNIALSYGIDVDK